MSEPTSVDIDQQRELIDLRKRLSELNVRYQGTVSLISVLHREGANIQAMPNCECEWCQVARSRCQTCHGTGCDPAALRSCPDCRGGSSG